VNISFRACVVAVGLLVTTSALPEAQTPAPTASLTGVVRDPAGNPIRDVSVSLIGESDAARTDTAGKFALHGAPSGMHAVLFRKVGMRSVEYRWPARDSVTLQIAVTMQPAARERGRR
jgi:hypothetical protein